MTTSSGCQWSNTARAAETLSGICSEVGGNVRGLGDEPSGGVKERAGEVEAFLDIGRITCALEGDPHLLGDAAETMAVKLKCDGIGSHEEAVVSGQ